MLRNVARIFAELCRNAETERLVPSESGNSPLYEFMEQLEV
jgi:hypothetical protein